MTNELIQLSVSAQILLAGVFPAIIIALGIAYAIKQRRTKNNQDRRNQPSDPHDDQPRP